MLQLRQREFERAARLWPRISHSVSVIKSSQDYKKMVAFVDALTDTIGKNEKHSLAPLIDLLMVLIEDYENKHLEEPKGNPVSALRLLMEEHGLTQADLPEVGSQGVVSEILSGKRILNLRQVRALANRFHVSSSVFID